MIDEKDAITPTTTDETQKRLADILEPLLINGDGEDAFLMELVQLFAMPDDDFNAISGIVLDEIRKTLQSPNSKLMLAQLADANGTFSEDIIQQLDVIRDAVKDIDISQEKRDFIVSMFACVSQVINETEGISKRFIPVSIECCNEKAKIPQYAHVSDSGADVYAIEDIIIHPGETKLIPTGLKVALPPGYEIQVRAKSGRALKTKMRLCNAIGTIDQGYRDEIKVIIENIEPNIKDITIDKEGRITSIEYGKDYFINAGEKFCQLVLSEVPKAVFYEVKTLPEIGEDREGGFGSTGLK